MAKFKNKYRIESNRLPYYDYSQPGAYFVNIVTHNRQCIFGHIENKKMILNDFGKIAEQCWLEIPTHFPNVQLDEFVIMPNHIHGIIVITYGINNNVVETRHAVSLQQQQQQQQRQQPIEKFGKPRSGALSTIIRSYKSAVTRQINIVYGNNNYGNNNYWQRNYYEHIVRNDDEFNRIRQYIIENPMKWEMDDNYMN